MSANQENHGGTLVVRVERLNCNNVDIHGPLVATVFCFIWFIFLIDIIFAFTQENIFYILSHLTTTKTPSCMWMANGITSTVVQWRAELNFLVEEYTITLFVIQQPPSNAHGFLSNSHSHTFCSVGLTADGNIAYRDSNENQRLVDLYWDLFLSAKILEHYKNTTFSHISCSLIMPSCLADKQKNQIKSDCNMIRKSKLSRNDRYIARISIASVAILNTPISYQTGYECGI